MIRSPSVVAVLCTASAWLVAGCAPALREPPALNEIRSPGGEISAPLPEALREAERRFRTRAIGEVERAVELWTWAGVEHASVEGWLGAARAGVWLADRYDQPEARRASALSAVQAGQWCGRVAPDDPRCDYWLALAIGVQARERRVTALDALPRMVELLDSVIARRPEIDHGGPHRVLALLLARAPGWPTGPGDPDRAAEEAARAVEIAPSHPPNQLALGETLAAIDEAEGSLRAYRQAARLAAEAVERGEPDAAEWRQEAERALR